MTAITLGLLLLVSTPLMASQPTCYTAGKYLMFNPDQSGYRSDSGSDWIRYHESDGKNLLFLNIKTGEVKRIVNPFKSNDLTMSEDGNHFLENDVQSFDRLRKLKTLKDVVIFAKRPVPAFSLLTNKIENLDFSRGVEIKGIKGDLIGELQNRFLHIRTSSGKVVKVRTSVAELFKPIEDSKKGIPEDATINLHTPNRSLELTSTGSTSKTYVLKHEGKAVFTERVNSSEGGVEFRFSKDGKYLWRGNTKYGEEGALEIVNTASGEAKWFTIPKNYQMADAGSLDEGRVVDTENHRILLRPYDSSSQIKVLDIHTGRHESLPITGNFRSLGFGENGNICGSYQKEWNSRQEFACFDETNGKKMSSIAPPGPPGGLQTLGHGLFIKSFYSGVSGIEDKLMVIQMEKVCPQRIPTFGCNCTLNPNNSGPQAKSIQELALTALCGGNFDEKGWESLTRVGKDVYSEEEGLQWLKRFSKPGGFDAKKHSEIVLGLIQAQMQDGYPSEMAAGLQGILVSSPLFYQDLIEKYPELRNLTAPSNLDCVTHDERESIRAFVDNYIDLEVKVLGHANYSQVKPLINLGKDVLSKDRKAELADSMADRLSEGAADSRQFHDVFLSKLYKFSYNLIAKDFNIEHHDLTDVTSVRIWDGSYQTKILGVEPFTGSSPTEFGIHVKDLKLDAANELKVGESRTDKLQWTHANKNYSADITFRREKIDGVIVSEGSAPAYDKMWKGGAFRGVVIAGSNMGSDLSEGVMHNYLAYYTENGFSFGSAREVDNLKTYLQDKVTGKEPMHYFVKEAHSDGDEKNLFRLDTAGKVMVGVRDIGGGKKEYVELVFPKENAGRSELLSNREFGEWMRQRDKSGMPELLYLNSSCWSKTKAIY